MPGLVDTHSHIGGSTGRGCERAHPARRARARLDRRRASARIQKAQAGGITTVNVMPGSGHLLSGQTLYLKLRDGNPIDDLLIRTTATGPSRGGIKMANGTNSRGDPPSRARGRSPRRWCASSSSKAQEYRDKTPPDRGRRRAKTAAARPGTGDPGRGPGRSKRDRSLPHPPPRRHPDRAPASQEFGFRVVLHHVSEAWKVADEIAAAGVPSSIIVIDSPGGKLEAEDIQLPERRRAGKGGRAGRLPHRRRHHRLAPLPALRRAGRAGGHVAGKGPRRA